MYNVYGIFFKSGLHLLNLDMGCNICSTVFTYTYISIFFNTFTGVEVCLLKTLLLGPVTKLTILFEMGTFVYVTF